VSRQSEVAALGGIDRSVSHGLVEGVHGLRPHSAVYGYSEVLLELRHGRLGRRQPVEDGQGDELDQGERKLQMVISDLVTS
jgi:hypothetical protein